MVEADVEYLRTTNPSVSELKPFLISTQHVNAKEDSVRFVGGEGGAASCNQAQDSVNDQSMAVKDEVQLVRRDNTEYRSGVEAVVAHGVGEGYE